MFEVIHVWVPKNVHERVPDHLIWVVSTVWSEDDGWLT